MDFRLLPTVQEILNSTSPDLFPNIIKGEYPDVDTYLDIHYTLQREDFIRPIREGLAAYRKTPDNGKNSNSLRIFHNVQFSKIARISHELGIDVLFNTDDCIDEDWENSKRFMRGSLLIFTKDDFKSVIMGTVLQHNPAQLRRGCVTVQLNDVSHCSLEKSVHKYTMVEPDTYFLPYSQVMKVLLSLDERSFPFRSEIIYAYKGGYELEYIDPSTRFELPWGAFAPAMEIDRHLSARDMCLNESQFKALTAALTNRLVLVQGPPGTGKTHVGTKIVEILLLNSKIWNKNNETPLLVVCATNHTLDQFLERLLPLTDRVVRVGDQSKSEKLVPYNLNTILRNEEDRQNQPAAMRISYKTMMQQWNIVEKYQQVRDKVGPSLVEKTKWEQETLAQEKDYYDRVQAFKEVQQEKGLQKLQEALIVGMTTTCAAQMNSVLQKLRSPIVVVEEAAEVLEAHIIASLTQYCKHLILIGDHQQLRPSTAHPYLSEKCHLEVSLFERLVNNGVPYQTLKTQHRMRPDIACLLTPVFYSVLENHPCTLNREHIRGMRKNMFFMSHSFHEKEHKATHGYSNMFEATFIIALCQHLLKQGYRASDIVILSMYIQQVRLLKQLQSKERELSSLAITSVDNFQGQESPIVLLSLVRNNKGTIGFLRTSNRTCVALSRARNGLYIFGNIDLLASQSPVWEKLKEVLNKQGAVGPGLPVVCSNHLTSNVADLRHVGNLSSCPNCS
ncbi:NFX1-type zinc finger-containing protein 1-like [Thrips palmi]|uniref:NFX1-type zinc finger-containing protein 1-like n=1 Tax=Thrips palmi TaxID=161013 RepID=A0A6P9A375_THRPL|nr:NFX1-type zinc finger-containing protein 1-like [Thrips palmi]